MNRRRAHLQSLHLYCLSCLLFCVAFNEDHCAGVDFYKPRNFVLQNKNKSTVPTLKQNVRSGRPLNEIIFPDRTPPPRESDKNTAVIRCRHEKDVQKEHAFEYDVRPRIFRWSKLSRSSRTQVDEPRTYTCHVDAVGLSQASSTRSLHVLGSLKHFHIERCVIQGMSQEFAD